MVAVRRDVDDPARDLGLRDAGPVGRSTHPGRELLSGDKTAGEHETVMNGQDSTGRPVGNGVYFARISTAGQEMVRKMIVVR